jgi:hypothetical protein
MSGASAKFISAIVLSITVLVACGSRERRVNGDVFIVTQSGESVKLGLVQVQVLPYEAVKKAVESARQEADREIAKLQPSLQRARADVQAAEAALQKRKAETEFAEARFYRNISSATLRATSQARDRELAATEALSDARRQLAEVEAAEIKQRLGPVYFARLPKPIASTKTDADGRFELKVEREHPIVLAAYATRRIMDRTETYYWLIKYSLEGRDQARLFLSTDNVSTAGSKDSLILTPE